MTPMSTNHPPDNDQPSNARNRGRPVAVAGILLMLGPVIAFAFTSYGFMQAFSNSQDSEPGLSEEIRSSVGQSMIVTIWGFGAAVVGSILVAAAVAGLGNRELWVYRNGLFLAFVMCLTTGIFGVIFGVGLIVILVIRRSEFLGLKRELQNGA